ncbi:hypothetical protein ACWDFR_08310 [Streptomyces sp. 900105755]
MVPHIRHRENSQVFALSAVAQRLAQELAAAEPKLGRQQKNSAATQRRITEIQEELSSKS